jgi:hypothetical protein
MKLGPDLEEKEEVICSYVDDQGIFYLSLSNNLIKVYDPISSLQLLSFPSYDSIFISDQF